MSHYGTAGLPFRDPELNRNVLVTAAHVAGGLSQFYGEHPNRVTWCRKGSDIRLEGRSIGHVLRSEPLVQVGLCRVDAVAIDITDDVQLSRAVRDVNVRDCWSDERFLALEDAGDVIQVWKRGAATGLTEGILDPTNVDFEVENGKRSDGSPHYVAYKDAMWVDSCGTDTFAAAGDSGSFVVDEFHDVVGMLVATQDPAKYRPPRGLVIPVDRILDKLRLEPIGRYVSAGHS